MNDTIQIPLKEYEAMKEELSLLKNNVLPENINRLAELLYEEKYGLYLGNDITNLTANSISNNWPSQNSAWDNV
jgi:hypothetical protein